MKTSLPYHYRFSKLPSDTDNFFLMLESLVEPLINVLVLWSVFIYFEHRIPTLILLLSILIFTFTFPCSPKLGKTFWKASSEIIVNALVIVLMLVCFTFVTDHLKYYNSDAILSWMILTPALQIVATQVLKWIKKYYSSKYEFVDQVIIVGFNEQGVHLANNLKSDPYYNVNLHGFFDDRSIERYPNKEEYKQLGQIESISDYVHTHKVNKIYITLPMSSHPRILKLLDDLKDTTASIYFVPDIFVTDLIQAKILNINGLPIVSVCDSPFTGIDGMIKRAADLVFASAVLIAISPILLVLAIGVKLSSPGPVIFKQRRYGLDGKEILVYKFRSMTVCEDGSAVRQATKNDQRITKFGAFLRKTSLDELPQFINVVQGRMSVVGPRPHAIAHNEEYRKLIKGYMVRHKVKPGITGWAQINGSRGETETVEKMEERIEYDLEYLRNWSPKLDMFIIAKTIWLMVVGQEEAY